MSLFVVVSVVRQESVAWAATVVLVRPPQPSAVATEATVRVRGELVSAGFDVQVIDAPPGTDIRTALEEAATGPEVEAVVAIVGDSAAPSRSADSAELWVIDRVTGKTVVRRVSMDGSGLRSAETLSIRALELLRASFLEVTLKSRTPKVVPQPAPVEVTRWTRDALQEAAPDPSWAVNFGGYVLASLEDMPASVLPLVRLERRLGQRFLARLSVAGLGTRAHVEQPATAPGDTPASADIAHRLALLDVVLRFRAGARLQPFLSLGAGVLNIDITGRATTPFSFRDDSLWSFAGVGGLGVRVALSKFFEVVAEAQAQVARPYPVIRFSEKIGATEGRPTLLGSLAMVAWM